MYYYEADTPSLFIDKNKLETNIHNMAKMCSDNYIKLRPHIKTHKIPEIALMQTAVSGNGIAVSKLGEAETMMNYGITDILIANEIIGIRKIDRLGKLCRQGSIAVCVDSIDGIEQLQQYLPENLPAIDIFIEIDTGMKRCGVSDNDNIERLLKALRKSGKLHFRGLLSHSGNIYGADNCQELERIALSEALQMKTKADFCRSLGYDVEDISIGSTPASLYLHNLKGVTEFRPGNYVFYDNIQVNLGVVSYEDCALSVLATVISKPQPGRVVIDAGSKSLGLDRGAHSKVTTSGYGYIINHPDDIIERLSEEHGILKVKNSGDYRIGDKISIIPNHACAVTNLFDEVFIVEKELIIETWKVAARGKVQ